MKEKKVDKNLVPASKLQQTLLFFAFFFLQSLGSITRKKMVPSFLKLGSFMKQRP